MRVKPLPIAALLSAASFTGIAHAQCANQSTGPDVIVGDVSGMNTYGAANGMAGYSLGTTSCNVGDAELNWISGNNQHPVIAQNIYRIENGRFEQIGQSWLKHGFFALQGSLCCSCIASSSGGSRLGVGCSDPYGAGLNGSQSSLGPRFQVNAYTGAFTYPPFAQGQTGDAAFKRIQVPNDDVDPSLHPNAVYIGDAQYIAPDDAAAGNGRNNSSWRLLTRPGTMQSGAWRLNVTGSTNREQAGIYAWPVHAPTAVLQEVNVPGEGQFVVGSNVIDNGNGTWNYEYAIFNNNSDFSAKGFSVAIGGGSLANVGSSFPHYHSGEPYTNDAWVATVNSGVLTFETDPHVMDPNANALRWGTTYSFWFTSNAPPQQRPASLDLFKPMNPGSQSFMVQGPMDTMGGGAFVSSYCSAVANSTALPGEITASNVDTMARTMTLEATQLPPNSVGFFLASMTEDFVANAGGSAGNICVGGSVGRGAGGGIMNSGVSGAISGVVDLDNLPTPTSTTAATSGQTWYFQAWHRDSLIGISTSNFTNGVRVTFL